MGSSKRKRQRENRRARAEAEQSIPEMTDTDLEQLLVDVTVRADCEHASTRTTPDGLVLTRCAVGASVLGGCPVGCPSYEKRRAGGAGYGAGAG